MLVKSLRLTTIQLHVQLFKIQAVEDGPGGLPEFGPDLPRPAQWTSATTDDDEAAATAADGDDGASLVHDGADQDPVDTAERPSPGDEATRRSWPAARGKMDDLTKIPVVNRLVEVIHLPDSDASAETKGSSSAVASKRSRLAAQVDEADAAGAVEGPPTKKRLRVPKVPSKPVA